MPILSVTERFNEKKGQRKSNLNAGCGLMLYYYSDQGWKKYNENLNKPNTARSVKGVSILKTFHIHKPETKMRSFGAEASNSCGFLVEMYLQPLHLQQ